MKNSILVWTLSLSSIFSYLPAGAVTNVEVRVDAIDQQHSAEIRRYFQENLANATSEKDVTDILKRAYFKWPSYTISVDAADDGLENLKVLVLLKEIMSQIQITGNENINARTLLDRINLRVGGRFSPEELTEAESQLFEYYSYRGFTHATIQATSKKLDSGQVAVEFVVDEGAPCRLTEIKINQILIKDQTIPLLRKPWIQSGEKCDAEKIFKSTEKLDKNLRKKGYLTNRITKPELTYDETKLSAELNIDVELGPKTDIVFLGNTFAFERDAIIEKIVGLEDEREFNNLWIESKAKESVKSFYRELGYAKANVTAEGLIDAVSNRQKIIFTIQRGPKFRISSLTFKGNKAYSKGSLEKEFWQQSLPATQKRIFVESEINLTLDNLLTFYQSHGFLRAQIEAPAITFLGKDRVSIVVNLQEGEQSRLDHYRVFGNTVYTNYQIESALGIKRGEPINPILFKKNIETLIEKYKSEGFKYVKIDLPGIEQIESGSVDYTITIDEGPKVKVGQVSVRGNYQTKKKVITRELTFDEGDVFSPQKMRESRRKLLQLGFFDSVSVESLPLDQETGKEDLIVNVSERKPRSIIFRPGYSTDDGARASTEFRYSNLFGTGRNFNSYFRFNRRFDNEDNILERRVVLTYQEPYLIDKIHGKISLIQEQRDEQQFDINRTSFILGLERNFMSTLRTSFAWELEFRNPFNELPGAVLNPIDETKAKFGSLRTFIDYDRRNDLLNATSGTFHRIEFDLYNRAFLSDADFYQVFLRNNFYYPIYKRLRSVLSLRLGFSGTYGETQKSGAPEIPIEKRFRLGGNNSFRGVGLNCIGGLPGGVPEGCGRDINSQAPGGNTLFNYMFEILIPVLKDMDLALFTDGGNAYLQNAQFNPFDIRNSVGIGIRYNTFFGPMRFDYGMLLDRRTGESFGTFHFAVGQF